LNKNRLTEEIADCGKVDIVTARATSLDVQPEKFNEGKNIDINDEKGCSKKMTLSQRRWCH
jgi:hypothetical protein